MKVYYNNSHIGIGIDTCLNKSTGIPAAIIPDVLNTGHRFCGGTSANFYNYDFVGVGSSDFDKRGNQKDWYNIFGSPLFDQKKWDVLYRDYVGYNGIANIIWPFINSITANRTKNAEAVFVLNIMNHYRNYSGYNMRKELFAKFSKLPDVNNAYDLQALGFSLQFQQIVYANINAFKALIRNKVSVQWVEYGNELYDKNTDLNNFFTDSTMLDKIIWSSNDQFYWESMDVFCPLCAMYKRLLKGIQQDTLFSVPVAKDLNGGFRKWNLYLASKQDLFEGISIHRYADISSVGVGNDTSVLTLDADFEIMNARYADYANYIRTEMPLFLQKFPKGTKVLYTETSASCPSNFSGGKSIQQKAGNTLASGIALSEFISLCLEANSVQENIAMVCYHASFTGTEVTYMAARLPAWANSILSDPWTTKNDNPKAVRYSAAWYAIEILKPICEDAKFIERNSAPGVEMLTFFKGSNTYFYFINKSKEAVYMPCPGARITSFGANKMSASFGRTSFRSNDLLTADPNITIQTTFDKEYTGMMPAMSVGIIKAPM